jgi:NADPH-dependent ferric siderophore reductase
MQRVTFSGSSLADFPTDSAGDYFKFFFDASGSAISNEESLESLTHKPTLRTYTVKEFNSEKQELTVDFVLHGDGGHSGPASSWAQNTQPGDNIVIRGPAKGKTINDQASYFLLAADMTALPALSAQLAQLPNTARGVAFIEIYDDADKQHLNKPEAVQIQWIVNSNPNLRSTLLSDAVTHAQWPDSQVGAWVACEYSNMKLIRAYLKDQRALTKEFLYISSYWKMGNTEEQHKVAKREDAALES